ncbi:MAG: NfeD family protein [Candidatus Porifericomitaceae bacterium WSBS_2022_MAG_OTU9]
MIAYRSVFLKLWLVLRAAVVAAFALICIPPFASAGASADAAEVLVINVDDAISPGVADYVVRGFEEARSSGSSLVLLRLNTPGGLDGAMRDIIRAVLDMPVPVVVQVWPRGGRAASAGAFILMSAHVAVMAPATNVGAASPVGLTGDIEDSVMRSKVTNDSVAYIREIASLRGRNADWAESAVASASSIGAEEALLRGVVEYIADDIDDVLAAVDGHVVAIAPDDNLVRVDASGLAVREFASDWRDWLLAIISNPAIAGILILVGMYSLLGELYSGGSTIVFGVIGVLCLLLGMYALQLLPGGGVAVALLVFGGVVVFSGLVKGVELLFIPGLVAIFVGLVMLSYDTLLPDAVAGTLISSALFWSLLLLFTGFCMLSLLVLYGLRRAATAPIVTGSGSFIGRTAMVLESFAAEGLVSMDGVIWRAKSSVALTGGQQVRVIAADGVLLQVEPIASG